MEKPTIIILAGGLGTRLRSVLPDLPKCMAPVNGKPFLSYLISYFKEQGFEEFIFSVGYKHEVIEDFLKDVDAGIGIKFSVESEPLGTGGAIKKACSYATEKNVFVANGDTLFETDAILQYNVHVIRQADCTLALKPMTNFDRYGVITLNHDSSIKSFSEKKHYDSGLINCGLYVLNVESFLKEDLPEKFSFETDYLEKFYHKRTMLGLVQDEYFIDIGIPEDYARASEELGERSQKVAF